ncbi:MAG: tetratricopeptide repeat protein [Candidatus Omnitrophota bacterium]
MNRLFSVLLVALLLTGCGLRSETQPVENKEVKKAPEAQSQTPAGTDFIQAGIELIKKGDVINGIHAFDEAIKQNPTNLQPYILLGQTYMHANQFDQAVDSFLAALRIAPDHGEIYYMLAIANGLRGRKDLAVNNAEKALLLFQKDKDGENFKKALVLLQGLSQE